MSDHKGARFILDALPKAASLIADRGYDSNWFRTALIRKGIKPCIPPTRSRKAPIAYDKALYRQRHRIENMFGRLKTGAALPPATIAARTPSSRLSASRLQSPSISINES
jgi:transposase